MDGGHAYAYLQRTADGRIALGGRGVPYQFGSRSAASATDGSLPVTPETTVQSLEATLRRLFPQVPAPSLRAEQAWSGVLGVARDWCPSVVVEPDGTPGGMYALQPQQGAQVVDLQQMGALPISIALGVALAAVLALALTIVASVRQRRRELALLKSVGMRRGQLRAVVASQTTTVLVVALLIGIPCGIAAGRWAWAAFAREIGVVPAPVMPAEIIALGALAPLVVGNLLATWPAAIAARTSVARVLRSE